MSFIIKAVHWDGKRQTVFEYFCNVDGRQKWDGDSEFEIPQGIIKYHSRDEAVASLVRASWLWRRDWRPTKFIESIRVGDKILVSAILFLDENPTLIKISVEELED